MKRVIEGKVYNTETAENIAVDTFGYANDFHYWVDRLYKTKNGRFFLQGEGGGLSHWARRHEDGSGYGEGIRVLSVEEARTWCEEHDVDADVIAEHFELEEA